MSAVASIPRPGIVMPLRTTSRRDSSAGDEERGADRAAEVPQRGDADGRRPLVDKQVLAHLVAERVHQALAEADAEATAEDYGFGVEQVDGGGDPGPECLDCALDQLFGEVVAVVQRPLPDAAGQARFAVLLHQLEEVGLLSLFVLAPRLGFHRRAAGVGLEAALAAAGALGAAALDDDVADLARSPATQPGLSVEDEPTADAGAPEDPDQALELPPGAEVELGFGRDLDVVADLHLGSERVAEVLGEREAALPAWEVAGSRDDAGLLVCVAGGADPDPDQVLGLDAGGLRRLAQRLRHRRGYVLRPAAGRRRSPRLADRLASPVDYRRLDLGAAEVDATTQVRHAPQSRWRSSFDGHIPGKGRTPVA